MSDFSPILVFRSNLELCKSDQFVLYMDGKLGEIPPTFMLRSNPSPTSRSLEYY